MVQATISSRPSGVQMPEMSFSNYLGWVADIVSDSLEDANDSLGAFANQTQLDAWLDSSSVTVDEQAGTITIKISK